MHFERPFIKLPLQFDAETLEREVRALPQSAWVPHPTGFVGNEAVRLVTVGGQPSDAFEGPMRPTENLARCPYVQRVMSELGGVWSRSRLMGLGAGAEVPEHIDVHHHWRTHVRVHVPIITHPKVRFTCGGETVHMAAGECWLFDSFRFHRVENGWTERRVHLVLDTVMTDSMQVLIDAAQGGGATEPKYVEPGTRGPGELRFEQFNVSPIMSPWEVRHHLAFLLGHAAPHPRLPAIGDRLDRFADSWAAVWAQFGPSREAIPTYRQILDQCRADVAEMAGEEVEMTNSMPLLIVLEALVLRVALAQSVASGNVVTPLPQERMAS